MNQLWISLEREFQRLKHAVMVRVTAGAIARSRKCGGGGLQRRVVSDGEPPIRTQPFGPGFPEVAVHEAQEVFDLFGATFVLGQPPVLDPIAQAHAHYQ